LTPFISNFANFSEIDYKVDENNISRLKKLSKCLDFSLQLKTKTYFPNPKSLDFPSIKDENDDVDSKRVLAKILLFQELLAIKLSRSPVILFWKIWNK